MASPSSLLAFFFLLLLLSSSSSAASASPGDAELLLRFKRSLLNPGRVLRTWLPAGDPCRSFAGVSCAASRVSGIRLDGIPLDADFSSVASSLLSLEHLQSLSLKRAGLVGTLTPPPLGSRCGGRLVELDLAGNDLRGSVTGIPAFSSSCSSLLHLNLSGNSLGFSPSGDVAGERLRLHVLDLSFNRLFSGAALEWFLLSSGGDLRELHLSNSGITGVVPVAGNNCSNLRLLDLSFNSLTGIAPAAFAACENLAFLNISDNDLAGEFVEDFLGPCRSLLAVDLSWNNLSGILPAGISACSALQSLNLANNNFSGELPLNKLTAAVSGLRRIQLSFNRFSGALPETLSELSSSLELLDLSSNSLSGKIPAGLCRGANGHSLRELYLQDNQFAGGIPPSISNCSMLVSLDLSFNYITGGIPSSIGSLPRLRELIMWQNLVEGDIPGDLGRLLALEKLILDNNGLTGAIPSELRNCTNLNWISLSGNRFGGRIPPWLGELSNLVILNVGNNSFSGPIPPELGDCKSLIWLDLNSNLLNGTIPPALAKQSGKIAVGLVSGKRYVYLKNDGSSECHGAGSLLEFAGIRPEQLSRLPTRRTCNFTRIYMGSTQYTFNHNGSVLFLDLSYNQLEGQIPPELGDMYYLEVLNLAHNALSGSIPPELGKLRNAGSLDLSHNLLEGAIPVSFSGLSMLSEIDLSNNRLNGSIPNVGQLATFSAGRYANNSGLCGLPLPPCSGDDSRRTAVNGERHQSSRRRQASVAGSVALGLLLSLLCILGFIFLAAESKKRRRRRRQQVAVKMDGGAGALSGGGDGDNNSAWKLTITQEGLAVNLSTFEKALWKLTLADLVEATNGFHDDCLVGSGGFGDVYRARLKDGAVVAVKRLIHVSGQGDREFTAEMETIGKVRHRNLIPLLGYCKVGEERLLVYQYMKHGSLEDVLHSTRNDNNKSRNKNKNEKGGGGGGGGGGEVGILRLNWAARRNIAVGAARGLAFLHNCIPHIIHRDMKSSNVLLDDDLEARVSDFGMARLMSAVDTHLSVSTLAGTPGYVPPEYCHSFRCTTKGDVYSYGVVLLELLTGRRPTDSSDFGDDNNLVGWVKQQAKSRVSEVFDGELLSEDPGLELELLEHLKVACACLDDRPARRPTMMQVMAMFKEIQAGSTAVGSAALQAVASAD
ncbi:unnamed protein product [Spirodela intermedia]|uniref:non-specific serine/threonine protein kinase n=1 Tax=Spirodela intermedia TaxID=51605 RepID=A0A7I8KHG1_SPIIN|nr:unnamed protein product [Spirodela intermedia]